MTYDQITQAIRELSDAEFRQLQTDMWRMNREREARDEVERARAEIVEEVWEAQPELKPQFVGTVDPDTPTLDALLAQLPAWVQPTSKVNAYPHASLLKHEGRAWRNRRRGLNSNEPGTPFSGWEDVTDELLKPIPVQDGNAEDADTTDAPGLITEPEAPADPAPHVKEWKAGEWYSKGEPARVGTEVYTSLKLHKATDATHPSKGTPEWMQLG